MYQYSKDLEAYNKDLNCIKNDNSKNNYIKNVKSTC